MREGTASRVMAVNKPYGEFYGFYSVSPEYFGYSLLICSEIYAPLFESASNFERNW
jgi:hypothetical protein